MILLILTRLRASARSVKRRTGTPPLSFGPPCQSDVKRTLRLGCSTAWPLICRRFCAPPPAELAAMVNAKFRDRRCYGFEMVDVRRNVANRDQSKRYGNFDWRHFSQIVGKLISM